MAGKRAIKNKVMIIRLPEDLHDKIRELFKDKVTGEIPHGALTKFYEQVFMEYMRKDVMLADPYEYIRKLHEDTSLTYAAIGKAGRVSRERMTEIETELALLAKISQDINRRRFTTVEGEG